MTLNIIQEVRGTHGSMYDIIHETDLIPFRAADRSQLHEHYGDRYIRYLESSLRVEQARQACTDALLQFQWLPEAARTGIHRLAAYKCMKAKTCDELTIAALFACQREGKYVIRAIVSNPDHPIDNHSFLICTKHEMLNDFLSLDISETPLDRIFTLDPDALIIDPYLNFQCPVSEFDISPLKTYIESMGLTKASVEVYAPKDDGQAEYDTAHLLADRVAAVASLQLGACSNDRIRQLKGYLIEAYKTAAQRKQQP